MSTDFFSSLNGSFDLNSSMSSLYGDYSQIKSGAYANLMKSYVNKVGNSNALKAYQETGSTTTATSSDSSSQASSTYTKTYTHKTNFLDTHFSSSDETTTSSEYEKLKSSWLDDQLSQYDKDASKTTAADSSVSVDTSV